jgi:hypothetical protein
VLFDESALRQPVFLEMVPNQDLHNTGFPDMIIVSHPDFITQAERLADFRRTNDGFDVLVVEPQQIYNEFSSGMQDPTAIRDFVRMIYLRAAGDSLKYPHYILLFGDGSYDPLDRLHDNTNFIPTWQTTNSHTPTSSFVSDDYFVLLDDGEGPNVAGSVDAGIGRLPATTSAEATVLVDKIMRYNNPTDLLPPQSNPVPGVISNFGDWRNIICFIADDEDGNLHIKQAEILSGILDSLDPVFNIDKIYLDAYQQERTILGPRYPQVADEIRKRMAAGALLVNYTGHGGLTGLAEEKILIIRDIESWTNYYNMPVLITATCEFSRYDDPEEKSAGEYVILNPEGGGSAILSTTRVAYAHSNMIINTNVIIAAFREGSSCRLGDIVRMGKCMSGPGVYMQNFTLLGDPSMRLAMPTNEVRLSEINGDSLVLVNDTIFAGQAVEMKGYICDTGGDVLTDFSGELTMTVYDKPKQVMTLANDPSSYVEGFISRKDVLFRGFATVTNGLFSISFTVPRDVSFSQGKGKISMYARSLYTDAIGVNSDINLVNDGNCGEGDGQGPDISLYIGDRTFIPGSYTGTDVKLIADLHDEDGINSYGVGFGHDIIMVLDDNFVDPMVMNGYYQPVTDHPESGTVVYEVGELSQGTHKIWFKAWDVLNYPSEAEIIFNVRSDHDLSLNHVKVYPNPMTDHVSFCLDRNQTTLEQWIQLVVKTLDGREIRRMEKELSAGEGISVCLDWDGCNELGHEAPAGVYLFSLKLLDSSGAIKQSSGKLVKVE